jgi:hypothetical protein
MAPDDVLAQAPNRDAAVATAREVRKVRRCMYERLVEVAGRNDPDNDTRQSSRR